MAEYDDTNKGALFTQADKESDRHPDLTGRINVNGTEYRLAAWKRESAKGLKYLALAVSEQRETAGVGSSTQTNSDPDF